MTKKSFTLEKLKKLKKFGIPLSALGDFYYINAVHLCDKCLSALNGRIEFNKKLMEELDKQKGEK